MLDVVMYSMVIIFMAELGDRSQLMAIIFGMKYHWRTVLVGISGAAIATMGIAAAAGRLLLHLIDVQTIEYVSLMVLFFFAVQSLYEASKVENRQRLRKTRYGWIAVASAFFVAEIGDKTMIAAASMAAINSAWLVWIGASIGMITANAAALFLGKPIIRLISLATLKYASAVIFFVMAVGKTCNLPASWHVIALLLVGESAIFGAVFIVRLRHSRKSKRLGKYSRESLGPVSVLHQH